MEEKTIDKTEKKKGKLITQILKFGVVGALAFLLDYGLMIFLTEFFTIPYMISAAISFTISTIFNYICSVRWVFNVSDKHSKMRNFILFVILSAVGLGINELIMWLGDVASFNVQEWPFWFFVIKGYMITKIIATAVVMVWNFITRKRFLEH